LSPVSAEIFEQLKEMTDADTDSEVCRNALRVQYYLLELEQARGGFYVRDQSTGEMVRVKPLNLLSAIKPIS
jgi:hypothetical protein